MTLPNFIIIGAPKCGSTVLYHYLRAHPDIFMPDNKEPLFFAWDGIPPVHRGPGDDETDIGTINDRCNYEELFEPAISEAAIGEASVLYLYHPWVAARIRRTIPDVKLIAVLRNPVERAYSGYVHAVRDGRESALDFAENLAREDQRLRDNWVPLWAYKSVGFYYRQLVRYYRRFPADQIRVYLFEDLAAKPEDVLRDVFGFLGVSENIKGDFAARRDVSGVTRSEYLSQLIKNPGALKSAFQHIVPQDLRFKITERVKDWNLGKEPMPDDVRQQLIADYHDDIVKLEGLIGRDLSAWYEGNGAKNDKQRQA